MTQFAFHSFPQASPRPAHYPPTQPTNTTYIIHKHIRNRNRNRSRIHWRIKKQLESGLTQPKQLATGNLQLATRNWQLFATNAARDVPQDTAGPSRPHTLPHPLSLSLWTRSLSHTNKSQFAAACEIFCQQLRLLCILHLRNHKISPAKTPHRPIPANPPGKAAAHAQLGRSKFCAARVLHEINCPTYLWQVTS